jgi:hypothetical protein
VHGGKFTTAIAVTIAIVGCNASGNRGTSDGADANHPGSGRDGGTKEPDGGVMVDAGVTGAPITCPGPGHPRSNGGSCGSERWNIKTGTDSQAAGISLVPVSNTIASLVALPAAGGGSHRESPTETTLWELKNVTLTELKAESDSDYHLVISDGSHTMIAEIPSPSCATSSTWACFISSSRSQVDALYTVSTSPQYPSATITLRGVGFFDYLHSQTGVAPNAIELHPILQICFGKDCTPT